MRQTGTTSTRVIKIVIDHAAGAMLAVRAQKVYEHFGRQLRPCWTCLPGAVMGDIAIVMLMHTLADAAAKLGSSELQGDAKVDRDGRRSRRGGFRLTGLPRKLIRPFKKDLLILASPL